jgi:PKD repeat protein
MRQFLLILSTVFFLANSQAQRSCGASHAHEELLKTHPELKKQLLLQEKKLQERIKINRTRKNAEQVYQVPVVIHVIHLGEPINQVNNISKEQIDSGMAAINRAFRNVHGQSEDIKIEFVLAKVDTNGNPTDGINRFDASGIPGYATDGIYRQSVGASQDTIKALTGWPAQHYYNIWLVNEIDGNDGGFGIQGYAYFPGAPEDLDGTLMLNTAWGNTGTANWWNNQSKTGIHELGHAFNLYHTFEGDDGGNSCPADPSGCGSGDGDCCDDTSPHIRSGSDCPTGENNTCTGMVNDDVIHNYMDYSSQNCQYMFSQDQKDRMRAALEGPRKSLLKSLALSDTALNFSAPLAAPCTPVTQNLDGNYMGIERVDFGNIVHDSWYARSDNPNTGYIDLSGRAIETGYFFTDSSYTFELSNLANPAEAKAWIDFNNNGNFDEPSELVFDQQIAAMSTGSQIITIPNSGVTLNTTLRMRVLIDFNTGSVPNACDNPTYGQGIDYPVVIKSNAVAPTAQFSASAKTICAGDTITFTDESIGDVSSRTWTFENGSPASSSDQTVEVVFSSEGVYNVSLQVNNGFGSDLADSADYITVNANPVVNINDTSGCTGDAITLDLGPGFASYEWVGLFNSRTVLAMVSDDYEWIVTNDDNCSASGTTNVTYHNPPTIVVDNDFDTIYPIDYGLVNLTFATPTGGVYSGNGVAAGQFDPASAGLGDHDIKYVYTDGNGCSDSTTLEITVDVATSVENLETSAIEIFPNPIQDEMIISNTLGNNSTYSIFDLTGKLISSGTFNGTQQTTIDSSDWPNGSYIVQIDTGNNIISQKVVKVK